MSTASPSSKAVGSQETASGLEAATAESFDQGEPGHLLGTQSEASAPQFHNEIDPIRFAVWGAFFVLVVAAWLGIVIWGLMAVT